MTTKRREGGRKIVSLEWQGSCLYDEKARKYVRGATEIEVRLHWNGDKSILVGTAVGVDVYAEGTDIVKVIKDCEAQLARLFPIEWEDKLLVNYGEFFTAVRCQIGKTKDGTPVYRIRHHNDERWNPIGCGEIPTGKKESYNGKVLVSFIADDTEPVRRAIKLIRDTADTISKHVSAEILRIASDGEKALKAIAEKPDEIHRMYPKPTKPPEGPTLKKIRVWTSAYRPMTMGGNVRRPVAAEVEAHGPHPLGHDFFGYIVKAPNGATFVAEAETGAFIGSDLEGVRADVAGADPGTVLVQMLKARADAKEAELMNEADFWKLFRFGG